MKASNWIVYAAAAVVSAFLLWLWYFLGLNHVDEPLDLVLSIVWWVVIAAAVITIARVERHRRERIRTIYVSDELVFNSEVGTISYETSYELLSVAAKVLDNLRYNFDKNDLPNHNAFPIKMLIKTENYTNGNWEGKVVNTRTKRETPFKGKDELWQILA